MEFKPVIAFLLICFASHGALGLHRWCCTSPAEMEKCNILGNELDENELRLFPFDCVLADGTAGCVQKVRDNEADLLFLDGGDIYLYRDDFVVITSEDYGNNDASYYAIAVVKVDAPPEISMLNLKHLKSCHTGVGKTSGWNTPMGWIARKARKTDEYGHIELIDPFSFSCAPGAKDPGYSSKLPNPSDGDKWCELCIGGEDGDHVCDRDKDERYYGYSGAFRCLKEKGEVAFVKHTTIPLEERDNFSLLCPDGSRAHPANWRECNLARVPAHGLVMRHGTTLETATQVYNDLNFAYQSISKDIFKPSAPKDLLWKTSTTDFQGPFVKTPREYLGHEYYCNMKAMDHSVLPDDCF